MSFIRLLALSYLAWAAVFVVAVVLVAHLPLPGNAGGGTDAPVARTSALAPPPAGKPDVRKVARLELAPVPAIPSPPADGDVSLPLPPVTQEPESKPDVSRQSPPVAVAAKPVSPRSPGAKPGPRPVARLDLAPAPVPVPHPQADAPRPTPHVVNQPQHKRSFREERVAALPGLPRASARTRGPTHLASAEPAFRIPDPPPSSLANLPAHLQPTASRNRKR